MRNKIFSTSLLAILLVITSCVVNSDDEFKEKLTLQFQNESNLIAETTQRQISQDSLITVFNFSVESGNNIVFTYKRNVIPPKNVQDGGLAEKLIFQIPPNRDQFELNAASFDSSPTLYLRSCFCPLSGAGFKVTSGTIVGEKLSNVHWIIDADVTIQTPQESFNISFTEPFYLN